MAHFHFNSNSKQALYQPYRRVDKMINSKDTVSRAIEERKLRESNIKRIKSSIVIQSHYRAHVVRCKLRVNFKEEIDVEISKSVESIPKLFRLITTFFHAYKLERKLQFTIGDDCYSRLLLIISQMSKNTGEIGKEIMKNMTNDKISMICMVTSVKKILALCIRFISNNASQQDVSLDVPLQMIKDFTCLNTYLRGQSSDEVKDHAFAIVTNIVDYLFNNDYYSAIKSLIENRLQITTVESQNGFPNDIFLLNNISYLQRNTRSTFYQTMIFELFVQPLKQESKKYLLLNLTNPSFPYMEMLESLSLIQLNQLTSAQVLDLFHYLLSLAEPHYANMKFDDLGIYFKIIVDFMDCLCDKCNSTNLTNKKDLEHWKMSCVFQNETNEADDLIEMCFDLLGNNHSLSNRLKEFLSFENGCLLSNKIISYLCQICYNLTVMQSQNNSSQYSFFKVLGSSSIFIRKLWEILNDPTEFSSFSNNSSKTDLQFFSTFCNTFKYHLTAITKDYSAQNINMKSNTKPFDGLLDISSGALTIVDCCLKMYFMICTRYKNNTEFRRVFEEATHLVRCLYDLDNKINFMNDKIWAVHLLPPLHIIPSTDRCKEIDEKYAAYRDVLVIISGELPFVFTFESRFQFFRSSSQNKLNENQMSYGRILLRRNHIYEDAFQKVQKDKEFDLTKKYSIGFLNNFGHRESLSLYYGPIKETLYGVITTGFNPDFGLFKETSERFLYPDPLSEFSKEEYLEHYYFLGMILGKAIMENLSFNLPFASFFLTKLLCKDSDELNFHHMSSLDPVLYQNLLYLRDTDDVESMDLYFNLEYDVQGSLKTVDLKPNGSSILVDDNNKHEYIRLFADWHLNKRIRKHCIAFKNGLQSIGIDDLRIFDHKELQLIISGANSPIDIEDLKKHTVYSDNCDSLYPEVIKNLWSVVGEMTDTQKGDLLKFVTGNRRPPPFGFKIEKPSRKNC